MIPYFIIGGICMAALVIIIPACIISGRESREEERQWHDRDQ